MAETGTFLSKDPWLGHPHRPQSLNGFNYTQSNPINATDRSGLFPRPWEELPAWLVVNTARASYSKLGLRNCFLGRNRDDGQWPSDTVDDLFTDYICEYGPEWRFFYGDAHLTEQLARSISISHIREEYYLGNYYKSGQTLIGTHHFDNREFFEATIDSILRGDDTRFFLTFPLDITHFLGTYDYEVKHLASNKITFLIFNDTTLESGTRIPPIMRGVTGRGFSLEELLEADPNLANQSLGSLLDSYPIISVLETKTREETTSLEGGGTMRQTFIWHERYPLLDCTDWLPPWPIVLNFLTIE